MTRKRVGESIGVHLYHQLSIAIMEKHVKRVLKPFDLYDDRSPAADLEVFFMAKCASSATAWDHIWPGGTFHDSLQPVLPRVYEWASTEWRLYLGHPNKISDIRSAQGNVIGPGTGTSR
jgi:hypothetical protein